jgi:hypothetical protein
MKRRTLSMPWIVKAGKANLHEKNNRQGLNHKSKLGYRYGVVGWFVYGWPIMGGGYKFIGRVDGVTKVTEWRATGTRLPFPGSKRPGKPQAN